MTHTCHAIGCPVPVDPTFLMCRPHWRMVPMPLQRDVWKNYRDGQCEDKQPSGAWMIAAERAIVAVAVREKKLTPAEAQARVEREVALFGPKPKETSWEGTRALREEADDAEEVSGDADVRDRDGWSCDSAGGDRQRSIEGDAPAPIEPVVLTDVGLGPAIGVGAPEGEAQVGLTQTTQTALGLEVDPPVKWVGSKRWVAQTLAARVAAALAPHGRYFEPFLGAGCVALALPAGTPMVLGDACTPLMGLWWWLKRDPAAIDFALGSLDEDWSVTEANYYRIRDAFNAERFSTKSAMPAARFLWLNRAGYNGLYRENQDGLLNVPWGKKKTVMVPALAQMRLIQARLKAATVLLACDFVETLRTVRAGDVVFADPPYDEVFASYTAAGFDVEDQGQLAMQLHACVARGATVLMTNSDTPRIRQLYGYPEWTLERFEEPRSVSAKASSRQKIDCLLAIGRRG
jgi:DNA adenine methylase